MVKSNPDPQIYGITGKKGHGKDTLASFVVGFNKHFSVIKFADDLKTMCSTVFNIPMEHLVEPDLKEVRFKAPVAMDLFLEKMKLVTSLDIKPRGKIANSPRDIMQYFGTEYVRSVHDNYWIERTVSKIKKAAKQVLVTDVRFPNEADAITALGGRVISVARMDMGSLDAHASEVEMEKITPDFKFVFKTGDFGLHKRISYLIALHKPRSLKKFNFDSILEARGLYESGATMEKVGDFLGLSDARSGSKSFLHTIFNYYGIPIREGTNGLRISRHRVIDGVDNKWCNHCKTFKPLPLFSVSTRATDMLHSMCKRCQSADHAKAASSPITFDSMLKRMLKECPYRKIECHLVPGDIESAFKIQGGLCFYSGRVLSFDKKSEDKISVDRIDSSLGYTRENIRLCTYRMNIMKGDMTTKEFYDWIEDAFLHGTK